MSTSSYLSLSNSTINVMTGQSYETSESISSSSLGDEYLARGFLNNYEVRQSQLKSHHTRWAGGEYVEGDMPGAKFDLGSENVFDWRRGDGNDGNQREGLREVLAAAVENGNSFSLVTNTANYVKELHEELGTSPVDAQAVESSQAIGNLRGDVRAFVNHLVAGDFGEVPSDFMIEVGTEYYSTDVWQSLVDEGCTDRAKLFGYVFAAISDEIKDALSLANSAGLNHNNTDISVAVQMGRFQSSGEYGSPQDNEAFISAFDDMGAMKSVDAVVWHYYRPTFDSIDNRIFGDSDKSLEYNMGRWDQEVSDVSHGKDLRLVCGWTGPAVNGAAHAENLNNYGAPGLTNILQEYSVLVDAGMDVGSIYGSDAMPDRVGALGTQQTTFVGGQLYGLMSQVLPGMHLLTTPGATVGTGGIYDNTVPTVLIDPDNNPNTDNSIWEVVHDQSVNTYAFEDDSKVVLFLAAKDFAGTSLSYTVKVEGDFSYGWATHLYDPDYDSVNGQSGIGVNSPGHVGVIEMPELYSGGMSLTQSGGSTSTTITFDHDFEVIRLVLSRATVGSSPMIISGTLGEDRWIGTDGADTLRGQGGNDYLNGNGGADLLDGGNGDDTLVGGAGNDTYVVDSIGDSVRENRGAGHDAVITSLPSYVLAENVEDIVFVDSVDALGRMTARTSNSVGIGNAHDNLIVGGSGDDSLVGGAGNDTLDTGDGATTWDTLRGGEGDDTYRLKQRHVHLIESANAGTDQVEVYYRNEYTLPENFENLTYRGPGPFIGTGNSADNLIIGGNDNDALVGGSGNDTLRGLAGADTLVGGTGDDLYVVGKGDVVSEAAGGGTDSVQTLLTSYHLKSHFENLSYLGFSPFSGAGNAGDNVITSGVGDDTLRGLAGRDRLFGGAGNDQIHGGLHSDTIAAGSGNDTVWGDYGPDHVLLGAGNDVFHDNAQSGALGVDKVLGGSGNDIINGGGGNDVLFGARGADSISGGAGNDWLQGGGQADTITANGGNDTVWGGNGRDRISLGAGDDVFHDNAETGPWGSDTVWGGGGSDFLKGGGGDDALHGNLGDDTLVGGDGNDQLYAGHNIDLLTGGAGADEFHFFPGDGWNCITDFEAGLDKIVLHDLSEHTELHIDYQEDNGRVVVDYPNADGDFHGGGVIVFEGTHDGEITYGDFVFV